MTAPKPKAPTLDIDSAIARCKDILDRHGDHEFFNAALSSLERLRAIENTKGVPGYPTVFNTYLPDDENTLVAIVRGIDYDALRLHAQHLQDRLNRMEALMREPSIEMIEAGKKVFIDFPANGPLYQEIRLIHKAMSTIALRAADRINNRRDDCFEHDADFIALHDALAKLNGAEK